MTRKQYEAYQDRVKTYLEGCEAVSTGPRPGCEECGIPEDAEDYSEEPWFSWSQCEICGGIAGNRESWHCIINKQIVHGTCCEDCVTYINYGQLDDTTMWEIEHEDQ